MSERLNGLPGVVEWLLLAAGARLRELGWIEGENLLMEYRDSGGDDNRYPSLAAELVGLSVDVIVAGDTKSALAAKQATTTIPIVFTVPDPVGTGLVQSLARPGGNATGMSVDVNLKTAGALGLRMVDGNADSDAMKDLGKQPQTLENWSGSSRVPLACNRPDREDAAHRLSRARDGKYALFRDSLLEGLHDGGYHLVVDRNIHLAVQALEIPKQGVDRESGKMSTHQV